MAPRTGSGPRGWEAASKVGERPPRSGSGLRGRGAASEVRERPPRSGSILQCWVAASEVGEHPPRWGSGFRGRRAASDVGERPHRLGSGLLVDILSLLLASTMTHLGATDYYGLMWSTDLALITSGQNHVFPQLS